MMSYSDPQEPLSNLSDSSFVILSQGSLPPHENDIISILQSDKETVSDSLANNRSTFSVFESTKSSIDNKFQSKWLDGGNICEINIQKKLNELVKENYHLKETLNQNNLAIKSQLEKFFMWQQEVLKTHESHKQKFLEVKDLILKLRSENSSLKKQLEDSIPEFSIVSEDNSYAKVHKKSEELYESLKKIREYEKLSSDLTVKNKNLNFEIQKLNEELQAVKNENLLLNQELEAFKKEKEVEKNFISFERESQKSLSNSEAHAQITNLLKQLNEEKNKVFKLKEELQKCKPNCKLGTTEELTHYINNLDDMNISLDMQNQRFSSLQSWVSLAEENVKKCQMSKETEGNFMCEIQELKNHLSQEENAFKEKQESLQNLKIQFERLLEDYKILQAKLMSVKNNESIIEKYNEELCSVTSKLESKDKELILKQQECDELNEIVKNLTVKCEEAAVLKVQAEQFKADFNEERAEREKLAEKKEEMAEQIRFFQRRIQTLEQNHFVRNVSSPLESPGKRSHYLCPRCSFSFSDLEACEKHINYCLNLEFQT